jgi:uncharacterized protein (UPF0335 family)
MTDNVSAAQLRQFVERIERLTEERKGISSDITDVYTEASSQGFDKPAIREIIKQRAMDAQKRQERQAIVETYQLALGL